MKKTNKLLFIGLLFLGLGILSGCSKDKMEKFLWKPKSGGGTACTWNVNYYSETEEGSTISLKYENPGKLTFKKDGSGSLNLTFDGSSFSQSFTYEFLGDIIEIYWGAAMGSSYAFYETGTSTLYNIFWYGKPYANMSLKTREFYDAMYTIEFNCSK